MQKYFPLMLKISFNIVFECSSSIEFQSTFMFITYVCSTYLVNSYGFILQMFFFFEPNWFLLLTPPVFLFTDIDCFRIRSLYVGADISLLLLIVLEFRLWLLIFGFPLFDIKFY